ncbi:MAG: DSD1 family PLP-dependent enzyme [Chloroflexi bacterium]|nr:DSD1 family PLP-dependent enzyme [Chloroflexota bacterium]
MMIGCSKLEIDTPALVLDLGVMERNIDRMASTFRAAGVGWRPHTKAIKTPAIAHKLLQAGALGVTCAKVGEAEVMAAAGIRDILIANQVVGAAKIARLVNLLPHADVVVAADSRQNAEALSRAACEVGRRLRVVIEVDVGMHRAGVPPSAVVDFARVVASQPGLRFAGVMGWEGQTVGIADRSEKERAVVESVRLLTDCAAACAAAGLPCEIVSCGGTGTYAITSRLPGVTEIQAGGGIFADVYYREVMHVDHECALTVLATVTSRPTPTRVICDAGKKTMSSDAAAPRPLISADVESIGLSAEHARISLRTPSEAPEIGDKIEFVVGYSDTTTMLHDEIYAVRNGRLEVIWPILGRGKLR